MLKSGRQGSFTMFTSQTRKLEAMGLACSSADTVSGLSYQPALGATTNHHLLGISVNNTHLNFSNLNPLPSSKTYAGSLKQAANELNPVDRGDTANLSH